MIDVRFGRLSTGIKMLLILSAALLPLGLIALSVSLESANTNRFAREADVRVLAADASRRFDGGVMNAARAMAAMATGMRDLPDGSTCRRAVDELQRSQPPGIRFGIFDIAGNVICSTVGLRARHASPPPPGIGTEASLIQNADLLRITVSRGSLLVVGELPKATLSRLATPSPRTDPTALTLWQGDASLLLSQQGASELPNDNIKIATPVMGGQLALELSASAVPMQAQELLMVLLPILMWVAAGLIGWIVVNRLVLKPLFVLQQAVTKYDSNDGPLTAPPMTTPSQEIRSLAQAFVDATERQSRHETELAESLARQTLLTREVHHRVKNNLQVVSSLINLHARGARTEEAQAAYASIQRRVDALAVVHRHHFAEHEENHGVGLRALIGELASNLRATATGNASSMAIKLELAPLSASQDVAVPVAFLITEIAEMAMDCAPESGLTIRLQPGETPLRARLDITSPGLSGDTCLRHPAAQRFKRVVEGLARQLRAPMVQDEKTGHFAIDIPVLG